MVYYEEERGHTTVRHDEDENFGDDNYFIIFNSRDLVVRDQDEEVRVYYIYAAT